jgi:NAD(P)H dehydrogenase (quinone)
LECAPAEREAIVKIGVSGASGHLSRAVVSELLQRTRGHEIVAITRTPETVTEPARGRFGDHNRPESLAEAYAGLDRLLVITTIDPEPGRRGAQNVAAIDAAVRAGVKHVVFMSAVGTRQEEEPARGASYWRGEGGAVNTVVSIQASFAAGAFDIVTGDVERLGGRPPKPLRDVLAGVLKPPSA